MEFKHRNPRGYLFYFLFVWGVALGLMLGPPMTDSHLFVCGIIAGLAMLAVSLWPHAQPREHGPISAACKAGGMLIGFVLARSMIHRAFRGGGHRRP